jgi:[ribosomal protein S5]-alanine N-acetyltransferase
VIETERLLLRLPVPADAPAVFEAIGDAEVTRFIGLGETGNLDDAVEKVQRMQRGWREDGFGAFVVVRKTDNATLGRVGLLVWDPTSWQSGIRADIGDRAEVELGWTLARHAWGHGYATEAAAAVRDWAFLEVRPPRLISLIHPENERSQKVAMKIGEHFEHTITTHRGATAQLWTFAGEGTSPSRP